MGHQRQSWEFGRVAGIPDEGGNRSSSVSRGNRWSSGQAEAIRGHQRPSEAIRGHQRPSEASRGQQRPAEANCASCAGRMPTNNPIAHRCARGSLTKPRPIACGRPDTWRRGTGSAWLHAPRDWLHAPRDWLHARPQRGGEPWRKLDEPRRASTGGRRVGRGSHGRRNGRARLVEDCGASWAEGRPLRRRPRRRRPRRRRPRRRRARRRRHSRRRAARDGCSR